MARQEGACWRCGVQWAAEEAPPATLRAIAGGQLEPPFAEPAGPMLAAVAAGG
jgi:hypothetical protein